jgi:hypothetical protein
MLINQSDRPMAGLFPVSCEDYPQKKSGGIVSRCLLIGLACFLVQTSRGAVEWMVDADLSSGGEVSGFFTINSSNQLLSWDITVTADSKIKGTTFVTGQSESTAGGYIFENSDNGLSELALVPPAPGSLVGKTGTIQLETGDLVALTGSLYSEGTGSTGIFEAVRGTVTSVVPEVSPLAMVGVALVGWMALVRRRSAKQGA